MGSAGFRLVATFKWPGSWDESMDKDALKEPVKPYEFRAKPPWQRLIILLGGITVNVLLAIVIYTGILLVYGEQKLPVENMTYGLYCDTMATNLGMQTGDIITQVEGVDVEFAGRSLGMMLLGKAENITVKRDDETLNFPVESSFYKTLVENKGRGFISMATKPYINGFTKDSPLKAAGAVKGDQIVQINDTEIDYFQDLSKYLNCRIEEEMTVQVKRDGEIIPLAVTTNSNGMLGIQTGADESFVYTTRKYSFLEAFPPERREVSGF